MKNVVIGALVGAVVGAGVAGTILTSSAKGSVDSAVKAPTATSKPAASNGTERYTKQRVVYHINYGGGENDKAYRAALNNIRNHISAVGAENIDVKVVMHGPGLGVLKSAVTDEKLRGQVAGLKSQNVGFQVCNNTLKGQKISYEKDLFEVFKEDIVPSGVAELSRLQQMGYTYIKP